MVVLTDSVVFELFELYRRANKTCQGKLLVVTGLEGKQPFVQYMQTLHYI